MIKDLVHKARRDEANERAAQPPEYKLRGGNAGAITATVHGKCPRLSHLRVLGLEDPKDSTTLGVFEAGYSSEAMLVSVLRRAWPHQLKVEEECAVKFKVGNMDLTGRPDILLLDADGVPVRGVEAKLTVSMWKAIGVHYDLKPDSNHLIQSAVYAKYWGVPWSLFYNNRSQFHLSTAPRWMQDKFTQGTYDVEFKDGKPFKINPFEREYLCEWRADGHFYWSTEGKAEVKTVLTWDSILAYYSHVAASLQTKTIPAKPGVKGVFGEKNYNQCDYCDFAPVCNKNGQDYQAWVDDITLLIGDLNEQRN